MVKQELMEDGRFGKLRMKKNINYQSNAWYTMGGTLHFTFCFYVEVFVDCESTLFN